MTTPSTDPGFQAWRAMRLWDIVVGQEFGVCTNYAVGKIDAFAAEILNARATERPRP